MLLGDLNATPYDEDMRVLTGKVPEAGVGLVFNDAWEMLYGPEGGWTRSPKLAPIDSRFRVV